MLSNAEPYPIRRVQTQSRGLQNRIRALRTRPHGKIRRCFYCGTTQLTLTINERDQLHVICGTIGCVGHLVPTEHHQ